MRDLPSLNHHVAGPTGRPWLTFVPGIGNDSQFWRAQAERLCEHFQVITFDPWGHGCSPPPPEPCGFADVVQGVLALWDRLGVARSSVVGLGFGGSVSMALGIEAPARVPRVVACCCRARQPDDRRDFWRKRRQAAPTQGMNALADATVDRWLSAERRAAHPEIAAELRAMMKRTTIEGYRAYVGAFIEMNFEAQLEALRAPTLLVAAEHDHGGGPVEDMRKMAARIPGASFEVISGSGHICNYEAPERLNALLQGFLKREAVSG
jgi:3-oxoadipate enol-lactonase